MSKVASFNKDLSIFEKSRQCKTLVLLDEIQLRRPESNLISFNAGSNDPDTDMAMYSTDGTFAFHVRALDPLISHPQVNSSMHISAALGPITGSGEIHAAKFVGNDMWISGAAAHGTDLHGRAA